jgi:hypothetical protein
MLAGSLRTKIGLEQEAHAAEKAAQRMKELNDFNREHWGVTAGAAIGSQDVNEAVARFRAGPAPLTKERDQVQEEQLKRLASIDAALSKANEYLGKGYTKPKTAVIPKS